MSAVFTEGTTQATMPPAKGVMIVCRALDVDPARTLCGDLYDVVQLGDVRVKDRWATRNIVLWWSGSESSARTLIELGNRLNDDLRTVKFLSPPATDTPFGAVEAVTDLGWTFDDFFQWAKPRVKEWDEQAFREAVAKYGVALEPGVSLDEPPEHAPHEFPEAPPIDPEEVASLYAQHEKSSVFHVEPSYRVEDEWQTPLDFWGNSSLPEPDHALLPACMADYCFDQADLRGVDPAQAMISLPVIAAGLIRESVALQMIPGNGWYERARLWGAVIGEPSTKKSVGIEIADGYLKTISMRSRAAEEKEAQEFMHASKEYEGELSDYRREKKKNPSLARPEPPERPLSNRLWTDDTTLEGLAKILASHARGKIIVIKDELAGWFGSMDAYANKGSDKDRPKYLSAYEGKETYIDRSTPGLSYYVPSWSVGILGGIQPSVFAKISARLGADGMLQRFMLAASKPSRLSDERLPDRKALERWQAVCEALYKIEPHPSGPVRFSAQSQELRREASQWLHKAQSSGVSPSMQAAIGKYEGLLGRLALTFHCLENADAGREIPDGEIPLATTQRAWNYIRSFLFAHAINFYEAGENENTQHQRWVCGLILAKSLEKVTTTTLMRSWSKYRTLSQVERRELFANLCAAGWLRASGGKDQAGMMASQYAVNPAVHDGRFAEQASRYTAERARLAEAISSLQSDLGAD